MLTLLKNFQHLNDVNSFVVLITHTLFSPTGIDYDELNLFRFLYSLRFQYSCLLPNWIIVVSLSEAWENHFFLHILNVFCFFNSFVKDLMVVMVVALWLAQQFSLSFYPHLQFSSEKKKSSSHFKILDKVYYMTMK